ncbi:competence protein ComK [Pseudoneobacillus rhizosphaerae]|uniref:competence protein ComK n=1 Tax=Pseudoneobacillus rhizosphaerae TaxID=2880968 RepID=UPI001E419DF3|nr:competence protein ComK [Pseudoneobacillus rhizosphaerae]
MFTVNYYIINLQMVLMMGEYNHYGKLCTRIMELDKTFLVDKEPLAVLNDTINYIDFDLKGAQPETKLIKENVNICPILGNPLHSICAFPSQAYKSDDTIWFNPIHIVKTSAHGRHTLVDLSNGYSIEVHSRLSSFNQKWQNAQFLRRMTTKREKSPFTLIVDQKKKNLLKKDSSGRYNFEIFLRK